MKVFSQQERQSSLLSFFVSWGNFYNDWRYPFFRKLKLRINRATKFVIWVQLIRNINFNWKFITFSKFFVNTSICNLSVYLSSFILQLFSETPMENENKTFISLCGLENFALCLESIWALHIIIQREIFAPLRHYRPHRQWEDLRFLCIILEHNKIGSWWIKDKTVCMFFFSLQDINHMDQKYIAIRTLKVTLLVNWQNLPHVLTLIYLRLSGASMEIIRITLQ